MNTHSLLRGSGSQDVRRLAQFAVKPGSDLLTAIEEAARQEEIDCGVIVSGIGALRKAVFRNLRRFPQTYPVQPEDRLYLELERPMELVSLGGWIAPNPKKEMEVHAHFSASMVEHDTIVTLGGHLTKGTTCGIKVVVAVLVLTDGSFKAGLEPFTQSYDLLFQTDMKSA